MIKNVITLLTVVSLLVTGSCKKKEETSAIYIDANNLVVARDEQTDQMAVVKKEKLKPEDYAKIEFESKDKDFDFGPITQGDIVEHVFKLKNIGKADLIILEARASCGCTVPEWTKTPIKTGESGEIKISFNSAGKMGEQHKTVTLRTNTEFESEVISFKATINPKAGDKLPVKIK